MIVSWILRSLDAKIAGSIPYHVEAKPLWEYLERRFCIANGPRLHQLRAHIISCQQKKGMSVDDYFNRLMSLYDELSRLKPLHACSCGGCTCDVSAGDKEEETLHQSLIGIDDEYYGLVRSNLLSQSPSVTLDRAYQALLQEEKSRDIARGKAIQEESHAFALRTDRVGGRTERIDKGKLHCSHCKQRGHEANTCFKLYGYPDWWPERNRHEKGQQGRVAATSLAPGSDSGVHGAASNGSGGRKVAQAHAVTDEQPRNEGDAVGGGVAVEQHWQT